MTHDQFTSSIAGWLRDDAESAIADHLADVLAQTHRTRQRPWWSSPERWLPMDVPLRLRIAPTPRFAWLLLVLALILALTVAAVFIGTRPQLPEVFGPAANGTVAFGAADGDIYAFDPATGRSTPLITGQPYDRAPFFSRDGSMFVFARATCCGLSELMLAHADGTIVRSLTDPFVPPSEIDWSSTLDWSPDGSRLALIDASATTFSIVHVDGSPTQVLTLGMKAEDVQWRPNSQELVFKGVPVAGSGTPTVGLYLVRADGTGLRSILPGRNGDFYVEPALSPDGNRIVYTQWGLPDGGHLVVVDIDSGETRLLEFEPGGWSDYWAQWSPDGRHLVFDRGRAQETYHLSVGSIDGGPVVDIGPQLPWAAGAIPAFSPDGSKVIARYSGSTWIFDVTGGPGQRLADTAGDALTWQRVNAP